MVLNHVATEHLVYWKTTKTTQLLHVKVKNPCDSVFCKEGSIHFTTRYTFSQIAEYIVWSCHCVSGRTEVKFWVCEEKYFSSNTQNFPNSQNTFPSRFSLLQNLLFHDVIDGTVGGGPSETSSHIMTAQLSLADISGTAAYRIPSAWCAVLLLCCSKVASDDFSC